MVYVSYLGTFEQTSDDMIVSDPGEGWTPQAPLSFNLAIAGVRRGKWRMTLGIDMRERERNAQLLCVHDAAADALYPPTLCHSQQSHSEVGYSAWHRVGRIGVDTGQAGIYDAAHFQGGDHDSKWYRENCRITQLPTDYGGVLPHGAVAASGFGDGFYEVYVSRDSNVGDIVAVRIEFINDAEIAKFQQVQAKAPKPKPAKSAALGRGASRGRSRGVRGRGKEN